MTSGAGSVRSYTADFARIPPLADRPRSFLRPVLLIVGCGDVGMRVVRLLGARWRVLALTSSADRLGALRSAGAVPLLGNLDEPATLARLAGVADAVLHLAPPAATGRDDRRTAHLLQALGRSTRLRRLVYVSTTGVYGDCGGAWVDETRPLRPASDRALRRVDAEQRVRVFGRWAGVAVSVLRVPGIYALDRPGGDPRERLARGSAVLDAADDVYTNHIHADDLARACVAALCRGLTQRAVNVSDDTSMRMGDYFDLAADIFGMARPPRVSRTEAAGRFSPMQLSFMAESRRLANRRLKEELRLVLRHPIVDSGLRAVPEVRSRE